MILEKFESFNVSEVLGAQALDSEGNVLESIYPVVIEDTHYIGKFLSDLSISPISLDGLRYNLIDNVNNTSPLVNFDMYKIPTGISNNPINDSNFPRLVRFNNCIAYENNNNLSELILYKDIDMLIPLCRIHEIGVRDLLIVIADDGFEIGKNHYSGKSPHLWSKSTLTQAKICEFNAITELDRYSNLNVESVNLHSFLSIKPGDKVSIIDYYYDQVEEEFVPMYKFYNLPSL